MDSPSGRRLRHGYSAIRVNLDDPRDYTVPIGVVACQTSSSWYGWRSLERNEKMHGVDPTTRTLMRITGANVT